MKYLLLFFIIGFFFLRMNAQEKNTSSKLSELYKEIYLQDSTLYAAYNLQDLEGFMKYFGKDLEWYKDLSGLMPYDTIYRNFRQIFNNPNHSTRNLIKSSLEVYPLKDFGAISTGLHEVNYVLDGKLIKGTFHFFMVWKKTANDWKVTRVFSYGH